MARESSKPSNESSGTAAKHLGDLIGADPAVDVDLDAFRDFLDYLPIAVVVSKNVNGEPRVFYANASFESMLGLPADEVVGKSWSILDGFHHEDSPDITPGQALLQSNDDCLGTFLAEQPKKVLVETYSGVIQDEDSREKYRLAALVDVTERDRAQREKFAREIRDKDLLLKEIQHRVKNNLQLITALIRLDARTARGEDKATLDRLAGRIEALHFLYQALSNDRVGQEVDLGHYLSQIAAGVMQAHAVEGIRLDVNVETAPVSINLAMPVGLVVNELLTNAFKYAFKARDSGAITLSLHCDEPDFCRVVVSDDGDGLPEGVVWPAEGKLGALILQTLRENTMTELKVDSAPGQGTCVTIGFVCRPGNLTAA